jgi:predicted P-loop ATPase
MMNHNGDSSAASKAWIQEVRRSDPNAFRQKQEPVVEWVDFYSSFLTTKTGSIIPNVHNAIVAIQKDNRLSGAFRYNTFAASIFTFMDGKSSVLKTVDVIETTAFLQAQYASGFTTSVVADAIARVAQENAFDPLTDYVSGLKWDGINRLSTWLMDYCGAVTETDNQEKFVSAVGRAWMIAAVARAIKPGTKVDAVLIFQGKQGVGKSTAAAILGGDWFTDEMPPLTSKDAAIHLQGRWIIELGELAALSRSDLESTKGFLARTVDKFRPPYERLTVEIPRRCVFIGTTNSTAFLKDETGNRRFWPVECQWVDADRLREIKDQLFAEAVHAYHAGEKWWLTGDVAKIAIDEQNLRTDNDDELAGKVLKHTKGRETGICVAEIMEAMELPTPQPRSTHLRIASILRKEGWEVRGLTSRIDGYGRQKKFVYIGDPTNDTDQAAQSGQSQDDLWINF